MSKPYKEFADFENDLDMDEVEPGKVRQDWLAGEPEEAHEKLERSLTGPACSTAFRLERKILRKMYRARKNGRIDFDKPGTELRLMYHEGYLQAIEDIYKLLPRPKGD